MLSFHNEVENLATLPQRRKCCWACAAPGLTGGRAEVCIALSGPLQKPSGRFIFTRLLLPETKGASERVLFLPKLSLLVGTLGMC